jgi:hypothetical protein
VPLGLFPAEMLALFAFVAAVWARADREESRWQASMGTLGAATIAALFAVVNITEIVLAAKAGQLAASPAVIQALWAVHAAAFGLDLAAIAVALLGLSHAAASTRLIPARLAVAAWPGSSLPAHCGGVHRCPGQRRPLGRGRPGRVHHLARVRHHRQRLPAT